MNEKDSEMTISKKALWSSFRNRVLTAENENENENSDD